MTIGILRMYSPAKCYGFIAPLDGGPDVFLHVSELQRAVIHGVETGQHLTYELSPSNKGVRPMAGKVVLAAAPAR
jgi:CspA family cold shock protein